MIGRIRNAVIALCAGLAGMPLIAAGDALAAVRAWRVANRSAIVSELASFLAIPNVARDTENIERNAAVLAEMMRRRGIETRLLELEGSPPAVFGSLESPGARRTVVFYAHYDGQPAVEREWASAPWTPVLRDGALESGAKVLPLDAVGTGDDAEWRIYARSASDDKAPIIAMLAALDALQAQGIQPSVNLKFFFEGEEEAGSPHLSAILERHRDLLDADVWLFCDGPVHQSGRGQIAFGARGVIGLELAVYGPTRALHSGHYGNWAPNPAMLLVDLLGSMRDAEGTILIPGFAERVRPLTDLEKAAIAGVPPIDEQLRRELGLARSEASNAPLNERITIPAMNVRGLLSGGVVSEARNAIPIDARASIDFRLVPDLTPELVRSLVETHIEKRGYRIVREEPDAQTRQQFPRIARVNWDDGYPALRTSMDLPVAKAVVRAVEHGRRESVVRLPNLGGSLPLHVFGTVLGKPVIIVPMVNHDNNQHAKNENIRLGNLWAGIDMMAALMTELETW